MNIELVSVTSPNLATVTGDANLIANGKNTWQENAIEFAGRVCYNSQAKMGTSPNFIAARVREGHEDIIEHIVVTVRIQDEFDYSLLRRFNRHCEISYDYGWWIVSGNLRVWLDLFRNQRIVSDALPILTAVAPNVFAEFHHPPSREMRHDMSINVEPTEGQGQQVTLLGANLPVVNTESLIHHGSATFLFEGVSRALTHQLVRHRLGSYSQCSQRYISLEKGEWAAIIPPSIAENLEALQMMNDFYASAEFVYKQLRRLGIRKEDSRFLLPNATETRIVATMNFAAWKHFCWLRAVDKAAQWEIRAMGQQVLEQLYQIAPGVFGECVEALVNE